MPWEPFQCLLFLLVVLCWDHGFHCSPSLSVCSTSRSEPRGRWCPWWKPSMCASRGSQTNPCFVDVLVHPTEIKLGSCQKLHRNNWQLQAKKKRHIQGLILWNREGIIPLKSDFEQINTCGEGWWKCGGNLVLAMECNTQKHSWQE